MLFVSTKAGYVDAELLRAAGLAEGSHDVADGPHCVHPRCLGASLGRSLRSLKLATVRSLARILGTLLCVTCACAAQRIQFDVRMEG